MNEAIQQVKLRFERAVRALSSGVSVEQATAELTQDLYKPLPEGKARASVIAALGRLQSDPPAGDVEKAVREAHEALKDID